ncbi:DUF2911 domain-containing protein [Pontibacter actiniarum]|uniref:Dihydrolipoamide dehydrogenase n=1 Tax=Pontibacter actiniarum TaxID=323450 RepID=A0A1X9YTP3_9BACT|nr:DUF2911 domain-containing protein [Pontibacter actiniarum]ARS36233.1 hypothetical protein CA264_12750 [Pontibacter actiniarum]
MKKTIIGFALSAALLFGASAVQAQGIKMPAPSPSQKVEQAVGLSTISVDYSRPSVRNRTIFGDLVPYDKIWRTGANASTKIKFSDDVTIEGNKIPAGEYALYTIPGKEEWTVVIHKNTKHWGDGGKDYNPAEDLVRFKVKPQQNPRKVESFTINFTNLRTDATDVEILWDDTIVPFTVKTDVDSKVMSQIQQQVIEGTNVNPGVYAAAANYFFDTNRDLKQAHEWIKKANATDPKFWNVHTQAKIEAKMNNYKAAIKTAEKSMELAKAAGNEDYVRLNEKAIADWKKMK